MQVVYISTQSQSYLENPTMVTFFSRSSAFFRSQTHLNLVTDSTRNRDAIKSFPKAKDIFHTVLQHCGLFLDPGWRSFHGLNVNRHNTPKQPALG